MVYKSAIPQPTDLMSDSQGDILGNFGQIDTTYSVDHFDFNTVGADNGKHIQVRMKEIASPPAGVADQGTVYAKEANGRTQLFFNSESSALEYQLTRTNVGDYTEFGKMVTYGAPATANTRFQGGWTFLAGDPSVGGMLFQYGIYEPNPDSIPSSAEISFPKTFSSGPFSISLTPYASAAASRTIVIDSGVAITTTKFGYRFNSTVTRVYWTAIGV